jgi:hypothetical protein
MNRRFRQIAFLLILVFTANVQAWAVTMEQEISHDLPSSAYAMPQLDEQHHESHDCDQTGHHCCHAISHLLGQVSDGFVLSKLSQATKSFPVGTVNIVSTYPEGIYRPPRPPSLT